MKDEEVTKGTNDSLAVVLVIVGLVIVGLILAAAFSRVAPEDPDLATVYTYNGFTFTKVGQIWMTKVQFRDQPYDITMYYGPREVEDVEIEDGLYQVIGLRDPIYMALDDASLTAAGNGTPARGALAAIEIAKIVGTRHNILNKETLSGLSTPTADASVGLPIFTCDNASDTEAVLIFRISDDERVYQESPGCIIIEGASGPDLIRSADRLMLQLTGIMLE